MARPRTGASLARSKCTRHGGRCYRGLYYDHAGKRREMQIHALSKPDARRVVEQVAAIAALDQAGITTRAERTTLAEYARGVYMRDIESDGGVAESTAIKKMEQLEDHILPALGHLTLAELSTETVHAGLRRRRSLRGPRAGQPLAQSTLHGLDRVLSAVVHHAALRGYYGDKAKTEEERGQWRKPWRGIGKPKAKVRPSLDREELARVVRAADEVGGPRIAAAVLLAAAAGVRRGELQKIRRGHLRRDANGDYDVLIPEPKKDTVRAAYLTGAPARVIEAYLAQPAPSDAADAPLFPVTRTIRGARREGRRIVTAPVSREGEEMRSYVVSDTQWARIKERAELPPEFRFHDLRGAFAKLLSTELSEADVQRAMGHERAETTRIYTRTTRDGALRRAGEVLAQLPLFGEPEEAAE